MISGNLSVGGSRFKILAVYIAAIHPFHKSLDEFLQHGIDVLLEKPAFTNVQDWDEVSLLALKNLGLVETMKFATLPPPQALLTIIKDHHLKGSSVEVAFWKLALI